MIFDLHSHTTLSDGELAPPELVLRAIEKGVDVLAVTDHDTIDAYQEMSLNHDEITLVSGIEFFQSNIPVEEIGSDGVGGNIWTARRDPDGWTKPAVLGSAINSKWHDSFPCAAADGTLYFFSRRAGGYGKSDLYVSRWVDGKYEKSENLGPLLNTAAHEWDPFISPDQDYLIFCSTKEGGYGEDDLYITFRQSDGTWSLPVNMGIPINSEAWENRPWVTSDGKYLFFASTRQGLGRSDVYWVDADHNISS